MGLISFLRLFQDGENERKERKNELRKKGKWRDREENREEWNVRKRKWGHKHQLTSQLTVVTFALVFSPSLSFFFSLSILTNICDFTTWVQRMRPVPKFSNNFIPGFQNRRFQGFFPLLLPQAFSHAPDHGSNPDHLGLKFLFRSWPFTPCSRDWWLWREWIWCGNPWWAMTELFSRILSTDLKATLTPLQFWYIPFDTTNRGRLQKRLQSMQIKSAPIRSHSWPSRRR